MQCENYGEIVLLNIAYKIFSRIQFLRILPYVEKETGVYQCGFRQGKSTTDQIFTLR
jgi:sorting nexin-29